MSRQSYKQNSKNNVSGLLVDIIPPARRILAELPLSSPRKRFELPGIAVNRQRARIFRFATLLVIASVILFGVMLGRHYSAIGDVLTAYKGFLSAVLPINQNNNDAVANNAELLRDNSSGMAFFEDVRRLIAGVQSAPQLASALQEFNKASIFAVSSERALQNNWLRWMLGDGDKLVSHLQEVKDKNAGAIEALLKIRNSIVALGGGDNVPTNYLAIYSATQEKNTLLSHISDLVKKESNIAIFFMDDSKMRATGGLIRHYAIANIKEGEVRKLSVYDIRRHNASLGPAIIPPSPLIGSVTNWNAQNANWFFDFPTSVSKIFGFLQSPEENAYGQDALDGAIAINYKVITDILRATGPIELPDDGMVIDHHNFIAKAHKEFAENTTFRAGHKNIFDSLLPTLMSRIYAMPESDKDELMRNLTWRLHNKDIQVYFVNTALQNFILRSLWGGGIYVSSDTEYSDYLAVVISNIGGEKTDMRVRQKISLDSVMNLDGSLSNKLSITRIHEGDIADEAFYRAENRAHIRALVPLGAKLTNISGASAGAPTARRRPATSRATDADVELFENGIESGKAVFHEWLTVARGQSRALVMEYTKERTFSDRFRFIFEKQSGVDKILSYTLQAPPGFIFEETGGPIFEYKGVILPTRLIIDLTLKSI